MTRSLRPINPPSQVFTRQRNHQDPAPSTFPPIQQRTGQLSSQNTRPPGSPEEMTQLCTVYCVNEDTGHQVEGESSEQGFSNPAEHKAVKPTEHHVCQEPPDQDPSHPVWHRQRSPLDAVLSGSPLTQSSPAQKSTVQLSPNNTRPVRSLPPTPSSALGKGVP